MKEKVTINDIARMCNVSKSSVSRFLNKGYVSKENAEKIQAAIDATGFQSNFFASRIKAKNSFVIGIIAPSFSGYGIGKMLDGVLQELAQNQYQGMILQSDGKFKNEERCVQMFLQQGVDGILFLDSLFAENYRELFKDHDTNVLFANQECSYAPILTFDETAATKKLSAYLKEKGQKSILYIMKESHTSQMRKEVLMQEWKEQLHTLPVALHEDGIYDQAKEAIRLRTDIVLCDDDEIALCCMKYYAQMHIRIPNELSIVSFSERPLFHMTNPALTHISYDYEKFGKHLAAMLLSRIQHKKFQPEQSYFELVEQDSVADLS